VSETQVRMLMNHWYRPNISREEAISLVLPCTAGSFIVRDSSTVKGGYALTLKITEAMVRHRKKMGVGKGSSSGGLCTSRVMCLLLF